MKLTKFQLGGIPAKKLESDNATPFMNFFKFLIPGFKLAYDQKLAQQNYDAKMKALYRVRIPLQEVPSSVYKPKVLLAKKPKKNAPVALNKPITKHLFGNKLPTAQSAEQRYKNGTRSQVASKYYGDSVSIRGVTGPSEWYLRPPIILEKIRHDRVNPAYNDTTYAEQPAYTPPIRVLERAAGNNILLQGKKQRFNFFGNFFNTNYDPSTPKEQNEYDTLKRRFNTAWGVAKHLFGTTKGGIQPSDNTRVLHIPNNGEATYERTPVGYGDFIPLVGTYRAAQRIDKGEPNASYGDLIINGSMDLLGAGMVGSVIKAAGKANRIHKALKASGFKQVGPEPTKFIKTANRTKLSRGYMNPDKYYHINLGPEIIALKTVPNVDWYNVAMQPMIQTLRVPATAPFK